MASENVLPNAWHARTNYSGYTHADLDDDPDSPDGNWWLLDDDANDSACRVGFATPVGTLTEGAGLQEFKILVRKGTTQDGGATDFDCNLQDPTNTTITALATGESVGNESSYVFSYFWDAADLTTADGSGVAIEIIGNATSGGPPTSKRCVEIGAIRWIAEVEAATTRRIFIT